MKLPGEDKSNLWKTVKTRGVKSYLKFEFFFEK